MERGTVLIVDDSDSVCAGIASYFEVQGFSTRVAYDGEAGVRMARQHRPDVILLDIMMPVMDGWEAVAALRQDQDTAHIPIFALTALRLSQEQLEQAGFTGHLNKPVPPHRLLEAVEGALTPARAIGNRT